MVTIIAIKYAGIKYAMGQLVEVTTRARSNAAELRRQGYSYNFRLADTSAAPEPGVPATLGETACAAAQEQAAA